VGTSVLREAGNGGDFLRQIRQECGLPIEVISGEQEAELGYLANLYDRRLPPTDGERVVLDIGGGSTELTLVAGDALVQSVSLPLGVVKLTERFLPHDPPPAEALAALAAHVRGVLAAGVPFQRELRSAEAVGTAGTVTTLAALELRLDPYDPDQVTGHRLTAGRIRDLTAWLAGMPLALRQHLPGLEPGRADVIVAGACLLAEALAVLGFEGLTVTDGGLREGLLLDTLARHLAPTPPRRAG